MFRLLGFIIGSIVSIGALVLLVGTPDFHLTGDSPDEDRYDIAIQQLKEKRQATAETMTEPTEEPIGESADQSPTGPTGASANPPAPAIAAAGPEADVPPEETLFGPASDAPTEALADETPLDDVLENHLQSNDLQSNDVQSNDMQQNDLPQDDALTLTTEPEWHAFWNPFRSEIAANGFVRRLESVTGIDYRVTKVRHGVYQVAFPYRDPAERDTKLSQIAAATGLDLSGGVP